VSERRPLLDAVCAPLAALSNVKVVREAPLSTITRFGIGGPAGILVDTRDANALAQVIETSRLLGLPHAIIGGGTNLVVSDCGFDGLVIRYDAAQIVRRERLVRVEAGAVLQDLVNFSIASGLKGLETMTGIPGQVGGAIYGNAGAYGRSIQEIIQRVEVLTPEGVSTLSNSECRFSYRESIFKKRKDWVILSAELLFENGDHNELAQSASEIRSVRDAKYPTEMKCAGSIFKNLLFEELPSSVQAQVPAKVIREGKVASAWFLEQTGAKGMRVGDIQVASYHANLVYNDGNGSSRDLVTVIQELKRRVCDQFGLELEEEVQYVGFEANVNAC
jgi:UDP-N-acetylmuramate dehydrogenase